MESDIARWTVTLTGSFVCSFCRYLPHTIYPFLILRALQGLGIGCGFTVASAVLADVFKGKQLAQMTSYSAMVYSISVIVAPALGGYLQHYLGWRANFAVMALYALVLMVLIYFFIFETNPQKAAVAQKLSLKQIKKNYLRLFTKATFISNISCLILAYGLMIAFNIIGPFLLQNAMHLSVTTYGNLLLIVGCAYFLGATLNSRMLKRFSIHAVIMQGLAIIVIASISIFLLVLFGSVNVSSVISFVCLAIFGVGFIFPNCFANALDIFPEKGFASALIGSSILIGVSAISAIVAGCHLRPQYCLAYTFLTLAALSAISYLLTATRSNFAFKRL